MPAVQRNRCQFGDDEGRLFEHVHLAAAVDLATQLEFEIESLNPAAWLSMPEFERAHFADVGLKHVAAGLEGPMQFDNSLRQL
jgi:hypothetical protein